MSIKEDLAYLLQILQHQEIIVLSPDLRLILTEVLTAYENLYYELEKWKSNYQYLEKENHAKSQKCTKYHIVDYSRKQQYISLVKEYKCGICGSKLIYEKFLQRYTKDQFLCDICLRTHRVSSGIYHCPHCTFDVCSKCPDFLNISKLNKCPKCSAQIYCVHCLPDAITGKYSCFSCDGDFLDTDGVNSCENCEYRLCPSCEKIERKDKLFKEMRASAAFIKENAGFSPEKLLHVEKAKRNLAENPAKRLDLAAIPLEIEEKNCEKALVTFGDRGITQKQEKSVLEVIKELEKLDKLQGNPQNFEEKYKDQGEVSSLSFSENKQIFENSQKIQEIKTDFPINANFNNFSEEFKEKSNEYAKMFRKI